MRRTNDDDDPAICLLYVFLMFLTLGAGTAIAALCLIR